MTVYWTALPSAPTRKRNSSESPINISLQTRSTVVLCWSMRIDLGDGGAGAAELHYGAEGWDGVHDAIWPWDSRKGFYVVLKFGGQDAHLV